MRRIFMNRKNASIILFILFVISTYAVFYFSSQPPDISHRQSYTVVRLMQKINDTFDITDTELYLKAEDAARRVWFLNRYRTPNLMVRKSAHFGIYFILGIICSSFGYFYSKKLLMGFLLGISLPVTIAVMDEYNQAFVGRTSSLSDVIIDGAGAFTGTVLVIFIIMIAGAVKLLKSKL